MTRHQTVGVASRQAMANTPAESPLCADTAAEWARRCARRWGLDHTVPGLRHNGPLDELERAIERTIRAAAQRMAAYGGQAGHQATDDAGNAERWLRSCCDSTSEPDRATPAERTIRSTAGDGTPPPGTRPLWRWLGVAREQAQESGISWIRGRAEGPLAFDIVPVRASWTVIAHGWPEDQEELRDRLIEAMARAAILVARASGRPTASLETTVAALEQDCARCCREPGLQSPAWLERAAAGSDA